MKLTIPKTVRLLPLQDYDPDNTELADVDIFVWVDPPRSVLAEFDKINGEYGTALDALVKQAERSGKQKPRSRLMGWLSLLLNHQKDFKPISVIYQRELHTWYARLWSQGAPDTHWTAAELDDIEKQNPVFLEFLCRRSWVLIGEHRETVKKGSRPLEPKPPAPEAAATEI
jgi:hypothetical protein